MWYDAKEAILNSSEASSVYIGCDSICFRRNGKWKARYTTVVVVHKNSCNGAAIFYDSKTIDDYGNLNNRLLTEVGYALEAYDIIKPILGNRYIEIHLDINSDPTKKSNIAIQEAVGWVLGVTGIRPEVKPNAWAATHAADHMVRTGL